MDMIFLRIEDIEVIFPTKKESHHFGAPTPHYEFSSTCAYSWRKLKIQEHIFWVNFEHKYVLNRKSHGFDFVQIEDILSFQQKKKLIVPILLLRVMNFLLHVRKAEEIWRFKHADIDPTTNIDL